jgi:transposase
MSKYSEEFKFMVVTEYQEGKLGYHLLAKKHGIKSHKQIIHWVKKSREYSS